MVKLKRRFTMKLDLGNAAFSDSKGHLCPGPELARIFTELGKRVVAMDNRSECRYPITDINGNVIGEARIT